MSDLNNSKNENKLFELILFQIIWDYVKNKIKNDKNWDFSMEVELFKSE